MQKILQANFIVWIDPAKMEATAKINANDMQITVTQSLFQQKGIYHLVCKPTSNGQWELLGAHLISEQGDTVKDSKDAPYATDAALALKSVHKAQESTKKQVQPIASFSPPAPKLQPAANKASAPKQQASEPANPIRKPITKNETTGAAQSATKVRTAQAVKAAKKAIAPTPPPPPTKANRASASKSVQGGFLEPTAGAPSARKSARKAIISPAAAGIDAISSNDALDF